MSTRLVERAIALVRDSFAYLLDLDDDIDGVATPSIASNGDVLGDINHRIGQITAEKYNLGKERKKIQSDINGLSQKAEFAVEHGRDDLAKAAQTLKATLNLEKKAVDTRTTILDREAEELRALADTMHEAKNLDKSVLQRVEELSSLIARSHSSRRPSINR